MKTKLALLVSTAFLLSACATTVPQGGAANVIQQKLSSEDQKALNEKLNVAKDNEPMMWRNDAGNTAFELTTSNTHVNAQGLPCRNYVLVIDRDYRSKITVNAENCRDNGQWKDQ